MGPFTFSPGGVNQYANDQYNLKYAVPDATSFADELKTQQMKLGQYSKAEVVRLSRIHRLPRKTFWRRSRNSRQLNPRMQLSFTSLVTGPQKGPGSIWCLTILDTAGRARE